MHTLCSVQTDSKTKDRAGIVIRTSTFSLQHDITLGFGILCQLVFHSVVGVTRTHPVKGVETGDEGKEGRQAGVRARADLLFTL